MEDEKVGLHSSFDIYNLIFHLHFVNQMLSQVNKENFFFALFFQVLSFYSSESECLNVDKRLITSEKVRFAGYLNERELGVINILYGRYKVIANSSFYFFLASVWFYWSVKWLCLCVSFSH